MVSAQVGSEPAVSVVRLIQASACCAQETFPAGSAHRASVGHCAGHPQFNFRSSARAAEDGQMAANLLGTFAHPANSPMPLLAISFEKALFNTAAVITKSEPHFIAAISDFNFDVLCLRVLECIRKCFP